MPKVILLSEENLRACVDLDVDAINCIEQTFRGLATDDVIMPPILRLDIAAHHGEVDVKTAYMPGLDSFTVKISPGFFDNPKLGLPSLSGLMVMLSARTGMLEALLLDNGYLTSIRTAAAGAVAARWLARADAKRVAILGAGAQARLQLIALLLVRPIESVAVWAPDFSQAQSFALEMGQQLKVVITPCADIDTAMADADIAVTATPSRQPLIELRHLNAGLHITAMGSDAEHKNEISPKVIASPVRYFCDRLSQVRVLGELHHAIDAGLVTPDAMLPELGQVIAGQSPGRTNAQEITICDLTGTGAQDTAITAFAYSRAVKAGYGTSFNG